MDSVGSVQYQPFALMGAIQIKLGSDRNDAGWVDRGVTAVIVFLNVFHIDRLRHTGPLIQFSQITGQMWIVFDTLDVAFEMPVIHSIKADQGSQQSPVGFRDLLTDQVTLF